MIKIIAKVVPKSSVRKIEVLKMDEKEIHVRARLCSVPEDGKANEELVMMIAEMLDTAKSNVCIKSGHASRLKVLQVHKGTLPLNQNELFK